MRRKAYQQYSRKAAWGLASRAIYLLICDPLRGIFRYNMHVNKPVPISRDKTTFSIASLSEADDDKAYWQSKSVRERLQAVELMRQVIYGYEPASGRLQRIFEVAELTAG